MTQNITQAQLKELLNYCPHTGNFTWLRDRTSNKVKNKKAGYIENTNYVRISINKKLYSAHRIAWLYSYGTYPNIIDHINGDTLDNRIKNLRNVTARENNQNQAIHRKGKLVGICYNKQTNKIKARISINGKQYHIGYYNTELEAYEAYKSMEWLISTIKGLTVNRLYDTV